MDAKRPRLLVISRAIEALVKPPEDEFEIICFDDYPDREAMLREKGAGIEVILASGTERLGTERFDFLPDLKLIAVVAAGTSGIELDAAKARGIAVTNAGDLNAGDVAEYAVTMLLAHRREVIANGPR